MSMVTSSAGATPRYAAMAQPSSLVPAVIDVGAAGVFIASMTHALPSFAAILSVVWYLIQIWDSKIVQGFVIRHHNDVVTTHSTEHTVTTHTAEDTHDIPIV